MQDTLKKMPQRFTSIVKITDYILRSSTLSKILKPISNKFNDFAGYRKLGLRFNDIIEEENQVVQTALRRLPSDEKYARNYRIIRAHQQELTHHLLPRNEWIRANDDSNYLLPYILEAEKEVLEKEKLDNMELKK